MKQNPCASISGSAIFLILIAVILFGALSWAWMENSRSSTGWLMNEQTKAATTASRDCQNNIDGALKRLETRGCGAFLSTDESGTLLGSAGEPSDGSCALYHPKGGGIKPCGGIVPVSDACLGTPAAGVLCGDGTVYVALSPDGNSPMYTTPADGGNFTWDDGTANYVDTAMVDCWGSGQPSCSQGAANTALLAALSGSGSPAPYLAAEYCSNLSAHGHSDWYLPSADELTQLYNNRNALALSGSFANDSYWSSSEVFITAAFYLLFTDGSNGSGVKSGFSNKVRCVRKD